MIKFKAIYRSGICLVLLILIATYGSVSAQSSVANGFRISPVRSELTINKGAKSKISITIENPTSVPTTARLVINDFIASEDESGQPRLILDDNAPLPKNSFKFLVNKIPDINLGPKENKTFDVTVSVPADANSGGYYGAIRFVPIADQKSNVGLTASVGTIVLVTVPGNLKQQLKLTQLSAASPDGKASSFMFKGDVSVLTRLENTGDIHVKPYGKVIVKDLFGKEVASYEFNNTEPRANILPGSTRKFVDKLPKRKWLGRYTIESSLAYSQGGGDLVLGKANFWYLPLWSVVALVVLVLLVVGLTFWIIKKRHKKHLY